jgi:hypothetical protein
MAVRHGSAWDRAYDVRPRRMRRETTRRRASSRGAMRTLGNALILLRRDLIHGRCDLGPSLRQTNGVAHAIEELLFAVVVLPAPAVIELEKMRTTTFGEGAPFLGNRVERMRRPSCRHGGAGSQPSWRRGIVWSGTRTSNDRPFTGSLHPRHISESLDIIVLLRGLRAGDALARRDFGCSWAGRSG